MSSVCSERFLREIEIPPRKQHQLLLGSSGGATARRQAEMAAADVFSGEEALLQKFLPSGAGDDSDSDDPYSSDHFRMYEFKVRRCTRSRSHDWTDCPFAHPGEKARRRDPRRHHYSGAVCPDYRRGGCGRGDSCEFAHGVFECWLHPARYRTEACKDGKHCKRKVCFFAHSPRQLRILPPSSPPPPPHPDALASPASASAKKKYHHSHRGFNSFMSSSLSPSSPLSSKTNTNNNNNHCCVFCSCSAHHSPTSTLLGMSHLSPPMSPMSTTVPTAVSYKDALTDLMTSLEAMHFNESSSGGPVSPISPMSVSRPPPNGLTWLDVSPFGCGDDQPQFVLSPTTPSSVSAGRHHHVSDSFFAGKRYNNNNYYGNNAFSDSQSKDMINSDINGGSNSDPDLGWVNDLLM